MPVKQYTDLVKMLDDVAEYVRRHKVEVLWDDNVNTDHHQITTGSTTWAIAQQHVVQSGQGGSDREWQMRAAMRSHAGKTTLIKTLNAMKDAPPLAPRTAWARLLDDD